MKIELKSSDFSDNTTASKLILDGIIKDSAK